MPVSDLTASGVARLTNQQLADLALQADWDRRRSLSLGDFNSAIAHERERDRLLSQIH